MTKPQLRHLRAKAQTLPALFQCGKNGLTNAYFTLIDRALTAKELIKITMLESAHAHQDELTQTLCVRLKATLIQSVGHKIVLYRENPLIKGFVIA
jgi:RNA-binding protein